ncbi:MAG: hypothetical protein H6843_05075 [Rhodospirillaceae bacterium]|nr:hypothetical protein [Rhodospirillaceae bacterium]
MLSHQAKTIRTFLIMLMFCLGSCAADVAQPTTETEQQSDFWANLEEQRRRADETAAQLEAQTQEILEELERRHQASLEERRRVEAQQDAEIEARSTEWGQCLWNSIYYYSDNTSDTPENVTAAAFTSCRTAEEHLVEAMTLRHGSPNGRRIVDRLANRLVPDFIGAVVIRRTAN